MFSISDIVYRVGLFFFFVLLLFYYEKICISILVINLKSVILFILSVI